jgi:cytoskeletal protein CcmA (bactofilin family)
MFSKSSKSPRPASPMSATVVKGSSFSLIAGGVSISGDISASVDLHIDGEVTGDVRCVALVQGSASQVTGHIHAQSARLAGLVDGSITADDLVIESSARITGDIVYERISIAPGSRIDGRFTHKDNGPAGGGELKLITAENAA